MTGELPTGRRPLAVAWNRAMEDFAHQMRWPVDIAYPGAEQVQVALDNRNIHGPVPWHWTFEPKAAGEVVQPTFSD